MTLHTHIDTNVHVTGCLVCGKQYEEVIKEAVADYLHRTAELGETVSGTVLKCQAILDELQGVVFTLDPRGVSQAAACDGQVSTVSYTNTQLGAQMNLLPLIDD